MAPSIRALAGFRLLQALGACGGAVIARAMARDLFPPSELRRVFSMLMLVMGVSPILAPLIGGYILLWFGWASIFWTQALLGAACLLAFIFDCRSLWPPLMHGLYARVIFFPATEFCFETARS